MSRILIIHTPSQLEDASCLVDLLEASLSLPEGAVVCSSLPGYAWAGRVTGAADAGDSLQRFDDLGAAIALVDASAFAEPQLWFDVAAAWARRKRVAVLLDSESRRAQLPLELAGHGAILREDRAALVALIEDVAFDLGLTPRIGQDAQQALAQLSQRPPAAAEDTTAVVSPAPAETTARVDTHSQPPASYEAFDSVPAPPRLPHDAVEVEEFEELQQDDEPFELSEDDVEPVLAPEPRHSHIARTLSCELSFEAGRAIAECSFHRDGGGDFAAELSGTFGSFVDAVGGDWSALQHLGDVELWLGAVDNLLEALPPERRDAREWYEVGFQFSTLCSIGQYGMPDDPEQRASYRQMWNESMAQLRTSAANARIVPREIRRLQSMLEALVDPEHAHSHEQVAHALHALRSLAASADRGVPAVVAAG